LTCYYLKILSQKEAIRAGVSAKIFGTKTLALRN